MDRTAERHAVDEQRQAPGAPPLPLLAADDAPAAEKNGSSADQPTANQRGGVELRVGLSTLLGHDRYPGEISGWGPITAETARTLAATQRTGQWRYALTDPDGQLILAGVTRARPTLPEDRTTGTGWPTARAGRGGIVELHLPAALITPTPAARGPR